MKYILLCFLSCGFLHSAESVSIVLNNGNNTITVTATIDATALRAEYAAKKASTGKTDAELKPYRDVLILDAVRAAVLKARSASEQTDAERAAELAAQKAKLDVEFAKRVELKPLIEVKP